METATGTHVVLEELDGIRAQGEGVCCTAH